MSVLVQDFKGGNPQVQSGDRSNRNSGTTRASQVGCRRNVSTTDRVIIIDMITSHNEQGELWRLRRSHSIYDPDQRVRTPLEPILLFVQL